MYLNIFIRKLAAGKMFNVLSILGIVATVIAETALEHVPTHHGIDFSDEGLTLNERYFNDVRNFIKQRSRETAPVILLKRLIGAIYTFYTFFSQRSFL